MGLDFTGLGAVFDFGGKLIDKLYPDKTAAEAAKLEMFKLQQAGGMQELNNTFNLAVQQIMTNVEEAKSTSTFVAGWRPFVGWICGCSLAYNYILFPLIVWTVKACGVEAPPMPALDIGELMTLLFGMLGLGAMRSYDKQAVCPPK
jgi:hypothetical protein